MSSGEFHLKLATPPPPPPLSWELDQQNQPALLFSLISFTPAVRVSLAFKGLLCLIMFLTFFNSNVDNSAVTWIYQYQLSSFHGHESMTRYLHLSPQNCTCNVNVHIFGNVFPLSFFSASKNIDFLPAIKADQELHCVMQVFWTDLTLLYFHLSVYQGLWRGEEITEVCRWTRCLKIAAHRVCEDGKQPAVGTDSLISLEPSLAMTDKTLSSCSLFHLVTSWYITSLLFVSAQPPAHAEQVSVL